jgi:hypothetical protein
VLDQDKIKPSDLARTITEALAQKSPTVQAPKAVEIIVKELTKE